MYRVVRRAVMKTQATQTDTSSKRRTSTKSIRRSIPAYLTLSPRASKQILIKDINSLDESELSKISGKVFIKSESVHRIFDDSDEEEEVMQISIKVFNFEWVSNYLLMKFYEQLFNSSIILKNLRKKS
jgi:hypothetical protein